MTWGYIGGAAVTVVGGYLINQSNQDNQPAPDPAISTSAQVNSGIALSNEARAQQQWDRYLQIYAPVEESSVSDAMTIDSTANQDIAAGAAASDVRGSFDKARGSRAREMASMGINPTAGRTQAFNNEASLMQAAAEAGAKTGARRTVNDRGIAMRAGVSNLGRGMPNTVSAMSSGAVNANNSAANILSNQYSTGVNAWNANNANNNAAIQGYGQLIGQGITAYQNRDK